MKEEYQIVPCIMKKTDQPNEAEHTNTRPSPHWYSTYHRHALSLRLLSFFLRSFEECSRQAFMEILLSRWRVAKSGDQSLVAYFHHDIGDCGLRLWTKTRGPTIRKVNNVSSKTVVTRIPCRLVVPGLPVLVMDIR